MNELPRFRTPDGYSPSFAPAIAAPADFRFDLPAKRASGGMLKLIVGLGALNLMAFVAIAIRLGGTALRGQIVGGHYYLALVGEQTEVSRQIFSFSLLDTLLTFITTGAAVIAWIILHLMDSRRGGSFS